MVSLVFRWKDFCNQTVFVLAFVKQFSPHSSIVIKIFNEIVMEEECTFPCGLLFGPPPGLAATLPRLALMPCNCVSLPLIKLTSNPKAVTYVLDLKGDRIRWWHFLHRALNMPSKSPIARKPVSTAREARISASGSASGAMGCKSERPQRTSCSWMGSWLLLRTAVPWDFNGYDKGRIGFCDTDIGKAGFSEIKQVSFMCNYQWPHTCIINLKTKDVCGVAWCMWRGSMSISQTY